MSDQDDSKVTWQQAIADALGLTLVGEMGILDKQLEEALKKHGHRVIAFKPERPTSPVQGETIIGPSMGFMHIPSFYVPRELAEVAYIGYSGRYGTSQSLERLEERGGFGIIELLQNYEKGKQMLEEKRRAALNRQAGL